MSDLTDGIVKQTITYKLRTGRSGHTGDPSYGDAATFEGREEPHRRLYVDENGRETYSEVRIITEETIPEGDLVVWPAGRDTSKSVGRRPLRISRIPDLIDSSITVTTIII